MAPVYKLTYFDLRGLGEQIRMLLIDNEVEFEDDRFPSKDWPKLKPTMQFGQCPTLYDGSFQLEQSGAIMKHLARKHGLYGDSNEEMAYTDMMHDSVADLRTKYLQMIYTNYEDGKAPFVNNVLPGSLENFSKLMGKKTGGYINGAKITYADYTFFELLSILLILAPNCLADHPSLQQFVNKMSSRPNLVAYLASDNHTKKPVNGNGKQ